MVCYIRKCILSLNLEMISDYCCDVKNRGNRSYKPNPRLARTLDILFILHAEHEMNCSTAAARHLASRFNLIVLLNNVK